MEEKKEERRFQIFFHLYERFHSFFLIFMIIRHQHEQI